MMYRDRDMSDLIDENARLKKELSECRGMRQHWEEQAHRAQVNGLAEHESYAFEKSRADAIAKARDRALEHLSIAKTVIEKLLDISKEVIEAYQAHLDRSHPR